MAFKMFEREFCEKCGRQIRKNSQSIEQLDGVQPSCNCAYDTKDSKQRKKTIVFQK